MTSKDPNPRFGLALYAQYMLDRTFRRVLQPTSRCSTTNRQQRATYFQSMSRHQVSGRPSLAGEGRPASAPSGPPTRLLSNSRPTSIPPGPGCSNRSSTEHHSDMSRDSAGATSLDLTDLLRRSEPSVVKTRNGSVLSRGFILKTDHYPSGACSRVAFWLYFYLNLHVLGRALDLDLNVHGAPNFRAPRQGDLNVFGAAQPRTQGLRAILSILRCRPSISNPAHVVWFSTREEPIGMSLSFLPLSENCTSLRESLLPSLAQIRVNFLVYLVQFTSPVVLLCCETRLNRDVLYLYLTEPRIWKQSKID